MYITLDVVDIDMMDEQSSLTRRYRCLHFVFYILIMSFYPCLVTCSCFIYVLVLEMASWDDVMVLARGYYNVLVTGMSVLILFVIIDQ